MSGYLGDLSDEQDRALQQFSVAVSGLSLPENDDYYFLRWLRARSFDVDKAEAMLRKHLDSRKEMGADTILHDYTPPEALKLCSPGGWFGEDREGHPIWWDNFGNRDFRGLHRSVSTQEFIQFLCMRSEEAAAMMCDISMRKGRRIETQTIVADLGNLSLKKHYYWPAIETMRAAFAWVEDNCPERLHRVIVVKAPSYFPVLYNVVKHFIDEKTRNKIIVCGADYQEVLQRYVAPDQIPQAYGGLRCEPDPQCTDYVNPGCDVPEKFYLTNLTHTSREEMERVVVGRGSSHKVKYQVHHPNSILHWEFISIDHDVGFGVFHKPSGRSKVTMVPVRRKKSHIVPESGTLECTAVGTYLLTFDNSHSLTRPKEVFYHAEVLPPDTPDTENAMAPEIEHCEDD